MSKFNQYLEMTRHSGRYNRSFPRRKATAIVSNDDDKEPRATVIEDEPEEEIAAEPYVDPYQQIRTTSLENDPEKFIEVFSRMCAWHDATYEMSDDYGAYSKGRNEKDSIFATVRVIKNSNIDEGLKIKAASAYSKCRDRSYPTLIDWEDV